MRYAISTDVHKGSATQVIIEVVDNTYVVVASRTWPVYKGAMKGGTVSYRSTLPDWAKEL